MIARKVFQNLTIRHKLFRTKIFSHSTVAPLYLGKRCHSRFYYWRYINGFVLKGSRYFCFVCAFRTIKYLQKNIYRLARYIRTRTCNLSNYSSHLTSIILFSSEETSRSRGILFISQEWCIRFYRRFRRNPIPFEHYRCTVCT